jgi:hypothetical protein
MRLPFSLEEFLSIFEVYNRSIWPMQIVLYLLALIAVIFAVKKTTSSNKTISGILAFLWLWTGLVYHLSYFTSINKAAYVFGVLCIAQGLIFIYTGVFRSSLSFQFQPDVKGIIGSIFILYALVIYPLLGYLLGHVYPASPTFGAPCPTTIFTFGLLLLTDKAFPKYVLAIPLLWSIVGFTAALSLTIREDIGLLIAGLLGTLLIFLRRNRPSSAM